MAIPTMRSSKSKRVMTQTEALRRSDEPIKADFYAEEIDKRLRKAEGLATIKNKDQLH